MLSILKPIALCSLLLLFVPGLRAQTIGTLDCEDEGGFPTIKTGLYAFNINVDKISKVLDATVYLDVSFFPTIVSTEGGYYTNCTISLGGATASMDYTYFNDASITGIAASAQNPASQLYASAILTFQTLTTGGITASGRKLATAEERAKAVAAIKERGFVVAKGVGEH